MAEDFERRTPRDADQRYSASLRRSHGERGRRGNGDHDAGTDGGRLLNHLDGNPAGENDGARAARNILEGKGASQFVERVVPPNVLAGYDEALARLVQTGRVGGPGGPIKALCTRKCCDRRFYLTGRQRNRAG